ncbi:MAG TPA: hypothetical protein VLT58_16925, partial [Polyangia bacterium]|nr:hypothetical protein [Polyangia bacterium]
RFCLASRLLLTRRMTKRGLMLAAVLGFGACSSAKLDSPDGATSALGAQQCHWPEALNGADGRTACAPARAMVSCRDPRGEGCGCTTDGGATCDCSGIVGGGPWICTSSCAANQYVVDCGGVGPGPVPDPPAGCVFSSAVPAGISYYCCPCE